MCPGRECKWGRTFHAAGRTFTFRDRREEWRRGTLGNERKTFRSSPSLLGTERKTFCSSPRVFPSPPSILELTPKVYRPIGWQKSDAKGQRVSCHIRVWTSSDNGENPNPQPVVDKKMEYSVLSIQWKVWLAVNYPLLRGFPLFRQDLLSKSTNLSFMTWY